MPKIEQNNLYGIFFMVLNALSIAVKYAAMKHLTKNLGLNSSQVIFLYKFSLLLAISPWIFKDGLKWLRTERLGLHLIRGALSVSAALCFMYALQHVPMIDATALGYVEQVLWVMIGALYFKERMSRTKFFGIAVSFIGAMIIVYPDLIVWEEGCWMPLLFVNKSFGNFDFYYIFVLLSIALWASNSGIVKELGKTEKTRTQMFYVMLFSSIFAYPVAFVEWGSTGVEILGVSMMEPMRIISFEEVGLRKEHLIYVVVLALCYFVHTIAIFNAFKYSDISVVAPFEYSRMIFVGFFGYYFFGEVLEKNMQIGAGLIMISGMMLIRIEARRKRREKKQQQLERLEEDLGHA